MSQENVEAVRAAYEELARGYFSRIANFSDDYEFVTSPEMPDAGSYRGEAARAQVVRKAEWGPATSPAAVKCGETLR
jgi:ketosteroid isomerase-like protein